MHAFALLLMLVSSLSLYFAAIRGMPALVAIFLGLFILANLVELLLVK
jgi:ABC-type amino acid transport system permease subunit